MNLILIILSLLIQLGMRLAITLCFYFCSFYFLSDNSSQSGFNQESSNAEPTITEDSSSFDLTLSLQTTDDLLMTSTDELSLTITITSTTTTSHVISHMITTTSHMISHMSSTTERVINTSASATSTPNVTNTIIGTSTSLEISNHMASSSLSSPPSATPSSPSPPSATPSSPPPSATPSSPSLSLESKMVLYITIPPLVLLVLVVIIASLILCYKRYKK